MAVDGVEVEVEEVEEVEVEPEEVVEPVVVVEVEVEGVVVVVVVVMEVLEEYEEDIFVFWLFEWGWGFVTRVVAGYLFEVNYLWLVRKQLALVLLIIRRWSFEHWQRGEIRNSVGLRFDGHCNRVVLAESNRA